MLLCVFIPFTRFEVVDNEIPGHGVNMFVYTATALHSLVKTTPLASQLVNTSQSLRLSTGRKLSVHIPLYLVMLWTADTLTS